MEIGAVIAIACGVIFGLTYFLDSDQKDQRFP